MAELKLDMEGKGYDGSKFSAQFPRRILRKRDFLSFYVQAVCRSWKSRIEMLALRFHGGLSDPQVSCEVVNLYILGWVMLA